MLRRFAIALLLSLVARVTFALDDTAASTNPAVDLPRKVTVSDKGLNVFRFASPFKSTVFEPGAPIDESQAIGDKDILVLTIRPGSKAPFQMVVYLADKRIVNLTLVPSDDAPAANWTETVVPEATTKPIQRPADSWIADAFRDLVQSKVPEGFRPGRLPAERTVRFFDLTAEYFAAFVSGPYTIYGLRLHSPRATPILPQDLYWPDVKAVLIDGDRVGPDMVPTAFVLMVAGP
jgi:hypothetical protein